MQCGWRDVLAPPLCPYMEEKKGGGFLVLWVEGCADSTPLTIYGKICGGWGGEKGLHSTVGGGMCWLRPFDHIWKDTWGVGGGEGAS